MVTVDGIKFQRQKLDKIEKGIKKLGFNSREISLCTTNLQRSKMFLGLVLKDMDAPNPYPESHNKDSKKIEPTADTSVNDYNFEATEHIGKVKELRADFESEIVSIKKMYASAIENKVNDPMMFPSHFMTSILALEEAKMWLGQELARVHEADLKVTASPG